MSISDHKSNDGTEPRLSFAWAEPTAPSVAVFRIEVLKSSADDLTENEGYYACAETADGTQQVAGHSCANPAEAFRSLAGWIAETSDGCSS